MLAERILTGVMRRQGARTLALAPYDRPSLPRVADDQARLLYAHVPFCTRLCPYCSFNRFPFQADLARGYFRRLREEMRMVADLGYRFSSMYVGGGTPTVLVDELCATIDLARELFEIREVSSETNPDHLVPEVVDPLVDRVQRFSVGVQSFDDGLLKQMERYDKYGSGERILERIMSIAGRFHSLNVDMIFNFPSQTEAMLRRDVEMLLASGTNQTTFYPLMVSPAVADSLAKTVGRVDYTREAHYYEVLYEALSGGFTPATAWTFSRTGGGMIDEYIVDYEEYIGIGSGAFSYLGGSLYVNTFSLAEYARAIDDRRTPATQYRAFPRIDRMRYRFLMSLFGGSMDTAAFERDFGVSVARGLPLEMAFMRANRAFASEAGGRITLTPRGRYLLVAMMREFFVSVNRLRDQARAALSPEERKLLFGDGAGAASCVVDGHEAAAAASETGEAADVLPPTRV